MQREELIAKMIDLLQHSLNEQSEGVFHQASSSSSLIGPEAVVTSMALVSFITDVESTLSQEFLLDVTLVSEQALSRKYSPFRNIDVLADYILELAAPQNQPALEARHA